VQLGDGILNEEVPCEPEFLDPEYIQHLAEMSLDPRLSDKRHRTPGVSAETGFGSQMTERWMSRTKHSTCGCRMLTCF
jgi:hypothetical protein